MENTVIPSAALLVANLREGGLSSEEDYTQHVKVLKDLLRTLKHEPLQFEDAFALYLVEEEWDVKDAWRLARNAAREIPSQQMREALEHELSATKTTLENLIEERRSGERENELSDALDGLSWHENCQRRYDAMGLK